PAAKYALSYLYVQAEFGVCCPLSMTDSLARTLSRFGDPALVARYLPGLTSQDLDTLTQGAMFMTEQGAGSDVGATATRAVREGDCWRLYGDKWFCSNADADLALVLARPDAGAPGTKGLSLFLLPKTVDGKPNAYRILRLKEKLGTRDLPSGEIRLEGALAYLVCDPGRGFVQMADMIDMPLMQRQLLKLMLPAEAARSVLFFAAGQLQEADRGDEQARRRVRLLTP